MASKRRKPAALYGVSVFKSERGQWVGRWADPIEKGATGKPKQRKKSLRGLTETQRKDWQRSKADELRTLKAAKTAHGIKSGGLSPADCTTDYLAHFGHPKTKRGQHENIRHFVAWCTTNGIDQMPQLRPEHLQAFRNEMLAPSNGLAPSTQGNRLRYSGQMIRHAKRLGKTPLLTDDDIRAMTRKASGRHQETGPKDVMSFSECAHLLRSCIKLDREREPMRSPRQPTPIAPAVAGLILTGCRVNELLGTIWSEIDTDAPGALKLPAKRVKTGRGRTVGFEVSPAMRTILRALGPGNPSDLVFGKLLDKTLTHAARVMRERFGAVRWSPHGLRRLCGSVLTSSPSIYGAASLYKASARQGHRAAQAEAAYLHDLKVPKDATTIEAAIGIRGELAEIVREIRRRKSTSD